MNLLGAHRVAQHEVIGGGVWLQASRLHLCEKLLSALPLVGPTARLDDCVEGVLRGTHRRRAQAFVELQHSIELIALHVELHAKVEGSGGERFTRGEEFLKQLQRLLVPRVFH